MISMGIYYTGPGRGMYAHSGTVCPFPISRWAVPTLLRVTFGLDVEHFGVAATVGDQLVVGANFDNGAVF